MATYSFVMVIAGSVLYVITTSNTCLVAVAVRTEVVVVPMNDAQ